MKTILIVDNPSCCEECDFCKPEMNFWWEVVGGKCLRTKKDISKAVFKGTTDDNCPLKPIPQYLPTPYLFRQMQIANGLQNADGSVPVYSEDYMNGWNECIDELMGEINNEIT